MPASSPAHEHSSLVPRRERMGWAGVTSLALHGLLLGGLIVASTSSCHGAETLDQKPIAAKLVRLGTPRPENHLPRIPTAPPTPPAPKEAPVASPGATTPPPQPTPAPPAPTPSAAPAVAESPAPSQQKPAAPQAEAPKPPDSKQRLDDIMKRFAAGARAGPAEAPVGQHDGDPFGDADTAQEGERYYALVRQRLQAQYVIPSAIPEAERVRLVTEVQLRVERDGSISHFRIVKPSGNSLFDSALEAAVQRASPLPPPPTHLVGTSFTVKYRI